MSLRRLAVPGLVAFALAFTGCATTTPGGAPAGDQPGGVAGAEIDVDAAWLAGGSMIALVTWGSSTPSCAPMLDDATVEDGVLVVSLQENPEAVKGCDGDAPALATLVGLPDGVDPAQELEIRVTYGVDSWGETDLDAYDGRDVAEYTPSAGVVDDDLIAVLTWGSSSCAPVVASAEFDGEATLVEFETPASDQVCTMDMAPRVTMVSGFNVGEAAEVTLTGGAEFADPVTIPLAG